MPLSGDAVKFSFLGTVLGIGHPTGYPLYSLLLGLFSLLPFGDLPFRATLLSVLAAAGAVGLLSPLIYQVTGRATIAITGALLFAVTPTWWEQATQPEVYALYLLLLLAVLNVLLRWERTGDRRWLLGGAAVLGLSASHHALIVTALPAIGLFCLMTNWREVLSPRTAGWYPLFLIAGMLPYGYLFWRTAAGAWYQETEFRSIGDLVSYLTGSAWREAIGRSDAVFGQRFTLALTWWRNELTPLGFVGVLLGVLNLARWPRRLLLIGGALLGNALFALRYDIVDIQVYYVPCYALAVVLAASLVATFTTGLEQWFGRPSLRWFGPILLGGWAIGIGATTVGAHQPGFDDRDLTQFVREIQPGSYVFLPNSYVWLERFAYQIAGPANRISDDLWPIGYWQADDLRRALAGQPLDTAPFRGQPGRPISRVYVPPDQPAAQEAGFRPDGELVVGRYRLLWAEIRP